MIIATPSSILSSHLLNHFQDEPLADCSSIKSIVESIHKYQPKVVLYSHGMSYIDESTVNTEEIMDVNSSWPVKISQAVNCYDGHLVFISTGDVYDAGEKAFSEESKINPVSVIALSKSLGEKAVRYFCPSHNILRISNVYGPDLTRGACPTFVDYVLNNSRENSPVLAIKDVHFAPIYVDDVVRACEVIMKGGGKRKGTYNLGGPDIINFVELAQLVAEVFEIGMQLIPVTNFDIVSWGGYSCRMPKRNELKSAKLFRHFNFGRKRRTVKEGIKMIRENYNNS